MLHLEACVFKFFLRAFYSYILGRLHFFASCCYFHRIYNFRFFGRRAVWAQVFPGFAARRDISLSPSPRAFLVWSVIPSSHYNFSFPILLFFSSSHGNHKQNYDSADLFHHRTVPEFLATTTQQHQTAATRISFVPNDKGESEYTEGRTMHCHHLCTQTSFHPLCPPHPCPATRLRFACQSLKIVRRPNRCSLGHLHRRPISLLSVWMAKKG